MNAQNLEHLPVCRTPAKLRRSRKPLNLLTLWVNTYNRACPVKWIIAARRFFGAILKGTA